MFHLVLHVLIPLLLARCISPRHWLRAWLLMMATMVVDVDHLLATPVYDPQRCSIGYHPLHRLFPIALYAGLCLVPRYPWLRWLGLGLVTHMALDSLDCYSNQGIWFTP